MDDAPELAAGDVPGVCGEPQSASARAAAGIRDGAATVVAGDPAAMLETQQVAIIDVGPPCPFPISPLVGISRPADRECSIQTQPWAYDLGPYLAGGGKPPPENDCGQMLANRSGRAVKVGRGRTARLFALAAGLTWPTTIWQGGYLVEAGFRGFHFFALLRVGTIKERKIE